ncbi:MAG TPA: YIP1 family protein, partial [Pyrinomonadaceae bacterium]|nr:YIP1 family protein [Pyrinomonadaceae bacterium]
PGEVFQNLRRHPRWLVAALLMAVCSATYANLFMQRLGPDNVANYAIDKTLQMGMIRDNEQARKQVEDSRPQAIADNKNPVVRSAQAVSSFAGSVFGFSFLALIYWLFSMATGGRINFWQAFSVAVYAAFPVSILRFVLNTIVLYIKDPSDIHPILGQQSLIQDSLNFLVTSSENPVIFTLLGSFSLLMFYWVVMNAIGLKNGGEKVSGSVAWTISLSLFGLIVVLGCTMAFLFPSFLS